MKKSSGSDLVRGFSGYSGYCQAITRIELSMQVNTRSGHHLIFFLLEGRTKRDVTNGRWQSFFSWLFDYIKSSTFTRPQNCLFLAKPIKCQGLGMMILPQLNVSESLRAEDSAKTQNVMLAWKKKKILSRPQYYQEKPNMYIIIILLHHKDIIKMILISTLSRYILWTRVREWPDTPSRCVG